MIQNEERLQLVLEANNRASAVLAQVRKDIEATRGSTGQLNKTTGDYEVSAHKVRTGAIAFSNVAPASSRRRFIAGLTVILATIAPCVPILASCAARSSAESISTSVVCKPGKQQLVQSIAQNNESAGTRLGNMMTGDLTTSRGLDKVFGTGESDQQEDRRKQLAQVSADLDAALDQRSDLRRAAWRKERDESKANAKQLVDQAKKDGQTANDLYFRLANDSVMAQLRMRGDAGTKMLKLQAQIDEQEQEQQINKLVFLEDAEARRAELIERARTTLAARIAEIEDKAQQDAAGKRLDFADRVRAMEEARESSALKRKEQIVGSLIHNAIQAQGPLMKQLKRLALEPIAGELEGLAIREGVKAVTSWPNAIAMAKHAAGAALAIAGAREIYGLAGGGGSGRGGGAGGGGGSDGAGTFEPRDNGQGSGAVVVQLITRDPYGRESIQETMYQLERAGVMKTPAVHIPPTTGFRRS